ncbi:MAG: DUF1800 family protein [Burkholderiales bacterium]|nr:DUF1800 family protein [Burkholderiales bacterium]
MERGADQCRGRPVHAAAERLGVHRQHHGHVRRCHLEQRRQLADLHHRDRYRDGRTSRHLGGPGRQPDRRRRHHQRDGEGGRQGGHDPAPDDTAAGDCQHQPDQRNAGAGRHPGLQRHSQRQHHHQRQLVGQWGRRRQCDGGHDQQRRPVHRTGGGAEPGDGDRARHVVKAIGVNAWLAAQFTMPETAISIPANDNRIVQSQFLNRLAVANDQLRQKVAYALGEIIVISMNKNNYADETAPYLQILSRNAFGNYRTLLGEIAISSQMGKYLDLANSNKPTASGGANENFPRELMQLFSIGLYKLNLDGSNQLDSGGAPIPVYDQATVQQVALAMTGWTYIGSGNNNWENFTGPMVPRDVNHDMRAKSFLGCSLTAGQSTTQDMNAALDCIYKHPNVGPFISLRLIRSMVMSNPSPAYVTRVASVFNNNGSGVRGDLRAVVTAILTDAEARNDSTTPASGRLKDPIYHIISMLRALGGSITATNQSAWNFSLLAQTPLASPSVFNFYSPLFRIPHTTLAGPEFQIYTPTEAVLRGNFIWQILSNPGADFPLDLSRFVALGGNIPGLIDAIDQTLLYGRMSAPMRQSLANAIAAQSDNLSRARTALYLTLLSGQHAVQH